MKFSGAPRLLLVAAAALSVAAARPQDDQTVRRKTTGGTTTPIGDSIKLLANQLMDINATTADLTMDTRTPPKLKQQQQQIKINTQQKKEQEMKKNSVPEFSYPGVAIPMDELSLILEDTSTAAAPSTTDKATTTSKSIPTTDSGISTWILLTSQSTTSKPTRRTMIKIKPDDGQNATSATEHPKTTVKMRPFSTSTKRPSVSSTIMVPTTTTASKSTTMSTSTSRSAIVKDNKIISKIKASDLMNAQQNATEASKTTTPMTTLTPTSTASTTERSNPSTKVYTLMLKKEKENVTVADNEIIPDSSGLPLEAKDDSIELPEEKPVTKKPKRTNSKRKKNKNRRKNRPVAQDKMDNGNNSTKLAKVPKEKPIGTQIYNYLSREVMPTVGMGLVGLMVTAGLASYFLFPFGVAARRTYDTAIDRKDDSNYYYDYNSGGQAEEEVIGQVIAGMPQSSGGLAQGSYRSPYSSYSSKYRPAEKKLFQTGAAGQSSVQDYFPQRGGYATQTTAAADTPSSYSQPIAEAFTGQRPSFTSGDVVAEHNKETAYTVDDSQQQFVVGNIPKELIQEVTPVAVPEHGPRHIRLRRRRRRSTKKALDMENEVSVDEAYEKTEKYEAVKESTTTLDAMTTTSLFNESALNETTTENPYAEDPAEGFLKLMKNLLELKIQMTLEFLQNTTDRVSKYLEDVRKKFDAKQEKHTPRR